MGNISEPWGDAPREDVTDTAAAERVDPSGAGQESADHAGLPRACGGGNAHSHTTDAQTVGARPGRDLGAFGGVILTLTATPLCRRLVKWPLTATVGIATGEAAASGPGGASPWRSPA